MCQGFNPSSLSNGYPAPPRPGYDSSSLNIVVYMCIYFYNMQRKIALPGWLHACNLKTLRVSHFRGRMVKCSMWEKVKNRMCAHMEFFPSIETKKQRSLNQISLTHCTFFFSIFWAQNCSGVGKGGGINTHLMPSSSSSLLHLES